LEIVEGEGALMERAGRPTLRELLRDLVFSPASGTIRLNKERLILQRANHTVRLRDQLVGRYGRDEAFVILTRVGFIMGMEDADFVRRSWPGLDPGDAFTAGTRLHMLCGCVRLKTVHNDFDFRKGRFSGEFIWHASAEAGEHGRNPLRAGEPVCWSQVGYASGYATRNFGKLIVYKEVECLGAGDAHCRVIGKPAEVWGDDDSIVQLYKRDVLPPEVGRAAAPREAPEDPLTSLILSPVRKRLDQIARFDAPVLITGEAGAGKRTAVRLWSEIRFGADGNLEMAACDGLDQLTLEAILNRTGGSRGRRTRRGQTRVALTDLEHLAAPLQRYLARRLDEGDTRVAATSRLPLSALMSSGMLDASLLHRLSVATVTMPPLRTRPGDIAPLADLLLARAARRHGVKEPTLSKDAREALSALEFRGNITELNALLTAALIANEGKSTVGAERLRGAAPEAPANIEGLTQLAPFSTGAMTLEGFNNRLLDDALRQCHGNLSAAARLLGLSRAQFAYRLKKAAAVRRVARPVTGWEAPLPGSA
jgi:Activator of aromatic catabolism/Sigma-54 interaction domain/V4R domain/Bacterial regulatory protein, Fis family